MKNKTHHTYIAQVIALNPSFMSCITRYGDKYDVLPPSDNSLSKGDWCVIKVPVNGGPVTVESKIIAWL